MLRLIRWTASVLVVLVAVSWGVVWLAQADPDSRAADLLQIVARLAGRAAAPIPVGTDAPFALVDSHGQVVTDQNYRGRWMLVYFGYTYCPDVCPTTLQTLSSVLDTLGDKAAQIAPIFITVDPNRDTPTVVGEYVALFDQRLIGLTGSAAQITKAEAAYGVFSRRVSSKGEAGYMVDHSSYVYFMGPDGKLKTLFPTGMTEADMVAAIEAAISGRR